MANPEYVIVSKTKPHNSLWAIAEHYLGSGTKYKQLAAINNIGNPDYIVVGQKIYLSKPEQTMSTAAVSTSIRLSAPDVGWSPDSEADVVRCTFNCSSGYYNTDPIAFSKFEVEWNYMTDDGIWRTPSNSGDARHAIVATDRTEEGYRIYSYAHDDYCLPDNAITVRVRVRPHTPEITDKTWSDWASFGVVNRRPKQLPVPNIDYADYKITTYLDNIPAGVEYVWFYLHQDNSDSALYHQRVAVSAGYARAIFALQTSDFTNTEPHVYKVRCRAQTTTLYGPFSLYTSNITVQPNGLCEITEYRAASETAVYLKWLSLTGATKYEIQYAEKIEYLDASNMYTSVMTEDATAYFTVGGITTGVKYFFRVRGVNDSGNSVWSQIVSIAVGTTPTPPTTWSSVAAVSLGEPAMLYWIHNSEDGSVQTAAQLQITVNEVPLDVISTTASDYVLHTWEYNEGAVIQWCVRTAGVTGEFSEYSTQREIRVHAPVALTLNVTDAAGDTLDTLSSFPIRISGIAQSSNQFPIGYHVSVISNETYETVDRIGNPITIKNGDSVYSQYFATSDALSIELSACDIDLESGVSYTISCVASMDTGMTAKNSTSFTVDWTNTMFKPYADISINKKDFSANITPYCKFVTIKCYKVIKENDVYSITDEEIPFVYGEMLSEVKTVTGEDVCYGVTGDGDESFYCYTETIAAVEGVTLAVYRREFDGSFTELVTGIENGSDTAIVDPHPALDYARYRVVATYKSTGAVSYSDISPIYVGGDSIIIQWDEVWSNFLGSDDVYEPNPIAWTGSMVKLKANIDVTPQTNRDVSLVDYVGRKHSVSYYGTHVGEAASLSAAIPKDDVETIYALRRLSVWMGKAFVREPSGTGYWANVNVSFSRKHNELIIPVSLDITRVEGGI